MELWSFFEDPTWQQVGKNLLWIAAVITALGVIAKAPYVNKPIKWLWRVVIADPIGKWVNRTVDQSVSPKIEVQRQQMAEIILFTDVAKENQEFIKAALKNLHECVDRRASEQNERIEKLSAYTEEVLAEATGAKERIRQLYRALEVPVFESDAKGHFTYVNPAYSKLTGLSVENSLGEGWVEALHPEDRSRVFKAWSSATDAQIDFNSVYRFRNLHTDVVTEMRGSAKPLHDGRGTVVGWVGTLEPTVSE